MGKIPYISPSCKIIIAALLAVFLAAIQACSTPAAEVAPSRMHPSWDQDGDGVNDCEMDGTCDHSVDYTRPRPHADHISAAPSFDCHQELKSEVEEIICANPHLMILDQKLSGVYHQAMGKTDNAHHKQQLKAEQRGWIKGRDECWKAPPTDQCVEKSYRLRIAELQAGYALAPQTRPTTYVCEGDARNEFIVTGFETAPPTLRMERGDQTAILYRQPSSAGIVYEGRNTRFYQNKAQYEITWGYQTPVLSCSPGR